MYSADFEMIIIHIIYSFVLISAVLLASANKIM